MEIYILFARRCEEVATELRIKDLCQLHQWVLWHAGERGRSDCLPSDALLERCRAAFCSNVGRPSRMQRDVGVALVSLGLHPEEEVVLHEGYSLDFVLEWCGDRVGVEVDGPSHFKGREPNSATLLKRRQLRHLGWRLVSVPYWEWDEVVASSQRANEYLASLLTDWRTGGLSNNYIKVAEQIQSTLLCLSHPPDLQQRQLSPARKVSFTRIRLRVLQARIPPLRYR